jgi:hypothetical protein
MPFPSLVSHCLANTFSTATPYRHHLDSESQNLFISHHLSRNLSREANDASPRSPRSTIIAPLNTIHASSSGMNAKGELEDALEIVSELREEKAALHNTV